MIQYKQGDLFDYVKELTKDTALIHCCNNVNGFASGFVVPLTKMFPQAKYYYHKWFEEPLLDTFGVSTTGPSKLGNVQFIAVRLSSLQTLAPFTFTICNMISQNGVISQDNPHPFDYDAFKQCLEHVKIKTKNCKVIAPLLGAGLAGGDWTKIAPIIEEYLDNVTVFVLNRDALPENYRDKLDAVK